MAFQTPRHRINWKGKKAADAGCIPPDLNDLQFQNRLKARRFNSNSSRRFAPFAPRNTTSFIIRAKKSGGIASLVSPCPVTPAILPTPKFSPSREGLVDMAKEEWGVDGYGSMKGLIRLRPGGGDEADDGSSESDVEEHVGVERRLDHDLSRFEMLYPSLRDELGPAGCILENRVDDQEARIVQLKEENVTMKERLFLVERQIGELRRRMLLLEAKDANFNNNDNVDHSNNNEDNGDGFSNNITNVNENGDEGCSEKSAGDKCEGNCDEIDDTTMREGEEDKAAP